MCSFKLQPMDSKEVEEFQLPVLGEAAGDERAVPWDFSAWNFGEGEEASRSEGEASRRVEEIMREARNKAQEIERQAYEEGFEQGLKDGQEVGRRSLEEVIQRVLQVVAELEEAKTTLFHAREEWLLKLVQVVGRKLVARELSLQPETIRDIIAAAFQQLSQSEGLKVVVSPQDYEILSQGPLDAWPPGVELVADGSLSPGGVRLETALGEVDGALESRWQLIEEVIGEALEKRHAP